MLMSVSMVRFSIGDTEERPPGRVSKPYFLYPNVKGIVRLDKAKFAEAINPMAIGSKKTMRESIAARAL